MITRLWFALSVIWCLFWLIATQGKGELFSYPPLGFWVFGGPFLIGLLVRLVYRYVLFGPRLRR